MNVGDLINFPRARISDRVEKSARILAIAVGGVWAYYRFFRGHTFKPRLEIALTGTFCLLSRRSHLSANGRLKNVGLSKVVLDPTVSAVRVFSEVLGEVPSAVDAAQWTRNATLPSIQNHQLTEPGAFIGDNWPITLPKGEASASS